MLTFPKESPWSPLDPSELVSRAAAILSLASEQLPNVPAPLPNLPAPAAALPALPMSALGEQLGNRACPVTGAALPQPGVDSTVLRKQAHELIAGVFAAFGRASPTGLPGSAYAGRTDPFDPEGLRRQVHVLVETLLAMFGGGVATPAPTRSGEGGVPHLSFPAPVRAGTEGQRTFTVVNEEPTPSVVTLYCTNFVADCGYDIAAVYVTASPRTQTIAAGGRATFEIKIAVPQQAPPGIYSGLIQVMGAKYVKAVLSVEIR